MSGGGNIDPSSPVGYPPPQLCRDELPGQDIELPTSVFAKATPDKLKIEVDKDMQEAMKRHKKLGLNPDED